VFINEDLKTIVLRPFMWTAVFITGKQMDLHIDRLTDGQTKTETGMHISRRLTFVNLYVCRLRPYASTYLSAF